MTLRPQASAMLPTHRGNFKMVAFSHKEDDWMPHLALVHENMNPNEPVLVRIHSECITGDLFGSKRCDCGDQLNKALLLAAEQGGIVLYLRQEGRGIGIINKLKAYNLQDKGLNTIDANLHLGLEIDARQYDDALQMLQALGIKKIRLLTNNPEKIDAFENAQIELVSREPLVIAPGKENEDYLATKLHQMGHLLLPE
jgi:3,4-dihydroxy 2-butanone 4-phosphate synthase/GTP cyclohydrolase II